MDFPFPFLHPAMFPFPTGPMPFAGPMQGGVGPSPFTMMPGMASPFGMMPTQEQREEMSLSLLSQQKEQIAQTRKYFEQCLQSLDEQAQAIDKEFDKLSTSRNQRQPAAKTK